MLSPQPVLDDAPRAPGCAVHGAVEAAVRLTDPDGSTADEFHLHVTGLVRPAAGAVDVREPHDDGADPLEDAAHSGVESPFDVQTEGIARLNVQFIHLEVHGAPP
jgi:hypothetical protein